MRCFYTVVVHSSHVYASLWVSYVPFPLASCAVTGRSRVVNGAPKPAELNKGHIIRAFEAEFETRLTGVSPVAVQDPLDCVSSFPFSGLLLCLFPRDMHTCSSESLDRSSCIGRRRPVLQVADGVLAARISAQSRPRGPCGAGGEAAAWVKVRRDETGKQPV